MNRSAALGLAVMALGGCSVIGSNTEQDFLCEAQDGMPCATIDQADNGGSHRGRGIVERPEDTMAASLTVQIEDPKGGATYGALSGQNFGYEAGRYRVPEVVGRMWIAPYLDENKILHEARFVHFVVSEARWVNR